MKTLTQEIIEDVLAEMDLVAWALSRPANFQYEHLEGSPPFTKTTLTQGSSTGQ